MSTMANLRCSCWWLPKAGNSSAEYEDAVAVQPNLGRFAIADGATESGFAATWAQLLVKHFVGDELRADNETEWLSEVRSRWLAEVNHLQLPWFAEMKREEGAAATLAGLRLSESEKPGALRWDATIIGDSCLFHLRNDDLVLAFPMTDAAQFDNLPLLICSRQTGKASAMGLLRCHAGDFQPGDTLILATDALAQWLLRETAAGLRPWRELLNYSGAANDELLMAASIDWMEGLRKSSAIRNDDVTMLVIEH